MYMYVVCAHMSGLHTKVLCGLVFPRHTDFFLYPV